MHTHVNKSKNKQPAQDAVSQAQENAGSFQFEDHRPEALQTVQLQGMMEHSSARVFQPIQKKKNTTGLPDQLKSGIENLSGYTMDDVKVHYNSSKPAQLQAHAYAQGTDIHLGAGQEKHLPHEAWHVVQQKQGRVKPTLQMKGKININDDASLEKEADVMGAKALQLKEIDNSLRLVSPLSSTPIIQRIIKFKGETWGPGTEEAFLKKHGEKKTEKMVKQILYDDIPHPARNLTEALKDPRDFFITEEDGRYTVTASALVEEIKGGKIREAGEKPQVMFRPEKDTENMKISGLLDCIGIYVNRIDEDAYTQAVSGAHFLTPVCIEKDGKINAKGKGLVEELVDLVAGQGQLFAILVRSDESGEIEKRAKNAMKEIKTVLKTKGVSQVIPYEGYSEVIYRLDSKGKATWG
ncbi:eCIS core domain-containing protein [Spongiimicrobium salis]|uniref:eCIS core domain-containing protein n=1 Tax=Spongiimicrobium salis TaxID=1667022 RepID=UPI00374D5926